ncbi:MAG: zinc-dependent peptidase [Steroidobacteraceae bacterium]
MMRLVIVLLIALAVVYAFRLRRRERTATGESRRFERRATLAGLRFWSRLPEDLRDRLASRVDDFIARVPYTGAGGLVIDDRMRVHIAAQACLVTLGHDDWPFDPLHGITLHPDEFIVHQELEDEDTGVVTEGYETLSGQAIESDRIVLSWRDVLDSEARDDGYNVVIHEVTHFLESAHPGGDPAAHAALEAAHAELCRAIDRGEETLLDPYGAEDPTEFLAVAAELFFERPHELRTRHPTLYVVLRDSFRLDPASWTDLNT